MFADWFPSAFNFQFFLLAFELVEQLLYLSRLLLFGRFAFQALVIVDIDSSRLP